MSEFIIRGSPVNKLKVAELKEELGDRGLSKSGKKDELIARLVSYLEVNGLDEEKPTNSEEGSSDSKDDMMKKWQEEREQLLKENELRRQEEEAAAKAKEAEAEAAKAKEAEIAAAKAKEEEAAAAEAKKAEEAAAKAKQAEEAANAAKAAALAKEAEEKRKAEEKQKAEEQKKIEEEKKIQEQKRLKAEEDKQKAEAKRLKEEQKKKADDERRAEENRKQKEEEKKQLREAEERKAKESEEKQKEKDLKSQKDVSNGKEDESLILETAADDTLVMEIDQADIVTEEAEPAKEPEAKDAVQEPVIPTEAGQVKSLRRLGSKSGAGEERKRGWGTSKVTNGGSAPVTISSDSLKDIVPDMKPILENEAAIMEEGETASVDSDPDVAGPKVPKSVRKDKDEPTIKKKRITLTEDENETEFLLVTNLTRPFTVKSFQEMLKRTGTIEDFWIDRIKSTCCVQFSSKDQASETKMALNGVTWPVGNPKTLRVSFSTEEQMTKYKANPDGVLKPSVDRQGDRGERVKEGVREWDKDKRPEERETDRTKGREVREVRMRERSVERKRTPPPPTKSLEELFKKTTASPAVYWKPLTEEQIQQRIELRNKKMMEAKIMREMEDTKETLQRSKKLITGSPP